MAEFFFDVLFGLVPGLQATSVYQLIGPVDGGRDYFASSLGVVTRFRGLLQRMSDQFAAQIKLRLFNDFIEPLLLFKRQLLLVEVLLVPVLTHHHATRLIYHLN